MNAPLKLNVLWFAKTNHLKLELLTEPEDGEVVVNIVRVVARVLKNLTHSNLKTVMLLMSSRRCHPPSALHPGPEHRARPPQHSLPAHKHDNQYHNHDNHEQEDLDVYLSSLSAMGRCQHLPRADLKK